MKYYVYQLRLDGCEEPFYIGKGCYKRIDDHFRPAALRKRDHKTYTILKAQREGIHVHREKLVSGLPEKVALGCEEVLVKYYGRRDIGTGCLTNLAEGGEGASGSVRSDAFKQGISKRMRGKIASQETRDKISKAKTGIKMPPQSEASRKKRSVALTGRVFSEETRARMRAGAKVRRETKPVTTETRLKLSAAGVGRKNPMSEETKVKLSATKKANNAVKKAAGIPIGNPMTPDSSKALRALADAAKVAIAMAFAETLRTRIEGYLADGVNRTQIAKRLNGAGVKTAQGRDGKWTYNTVSRIIEILSTKP